MPSIVRPSDAAVERVDACIVVDVVRATTTAAILCERLRELWIARTPDDLRALPPRPGGYALFSELAGIESDLARFDNSPVQARDAALGDRIAVLVTTNGTRAVGLAAERADEVLLAGFVNLTSVVDHVRARGVARIAVMPAGNSGERRCAEDDHCADAIVAALSAGALDVPALITACRADARIVARLDREPSLGADLELCFALDTVAVVPRVADTRAGCFRVVAA